MTSPHRYYNLFAKRSTPSHTAVMHSVPLRASTRSARKGTLILLGKLNLKRRTTTGDETWPD
jgi:hypothetical protein